MNTPSNPSNTNKPSSIIEAQVNRLYEVVQTYQQKLCQDLLTQAQHEAHVIIKQAYQEARQRLHQDIQKSRDQMQQEIAAAKAKQHTQNQKRQHKATQQFLDKTWQQLAKHLHTRWQDAYNRHAWTEKILRTAKKVLIADEWLVEYPIDWPSSEHADIKSQIRKHTKHQPQLKPSDKIIAGIRISSQGATIDGTAQGLLADKARIEAEFQAKCISCMALPKNQDN